MGGNRANPEENHPEAGRLTIHLQTSCSTQNRLGSNSGKAVGKFTSGSNSSQANLFDFIFVLHSALRTPIGPLVCSQLLVKIVGDMSDRLHQKMAAGSSLQSHLTRGMCMGRDGDGWL